MIGEKHVPTVLLILDGWGIAEAGEFNAFSRGNTPHIDALIENWPHTALKASGLAVGLPEGQMGNSEVGHLNMGAGRVVYQDFTRINKAIENGEIASNATFLDLFSAVRSKAGKLHFMGLLSDGGVHSHIEHLFALLRLAKEKGLEDICIHAFMDGRDTPPSSGEGYLKQLENFLEELGCGRVASVTGRFYAMDRDQRWERVEKAFRALTLGEGKTVASSVTGIESAYQAGETDEFIKPLVVTSGQGPCGTVNDGDGIVFFNFRADRAREITRAFTENSFDGFERPVEPKLAGFACMTEYDEGFDLPIAFPPESHRNILGETLAKAGLTQLRIAETEKYAHVTFFFNGGEEQPFSGEERVLIPSPKDVATYDLKPAMSAPEVSSEAVRRIQSGAYDFIVLNFANFDMVGHTGILEAAVAAVETVDSCVGQVVGAALDAGGKVILTSDHGNCEKMQDETKGPHTAHTTNPVPLVLIDPERRMCRLREGSLADIAPTALDIMGLEKPPEMTGESLILA
ncbi:MAG: 2,3-bisphosphoglycerate-independent phosphoglycerate mutase [Deltaproteobacteria bacterium]|nr:2,3-bisphosphoglycerate-independent phosphoglycerate mutase [Deltaproteobacteria bacterium]